MASACHCPTEESSTCKAISGINGIFSDERYPSPRAYAAMLKRSRLPVERMHQVASISCRQQSLIIDRLPLQKK